MQDKEFDKLFQQRFETFEFEPSEAVWSNINSALKNSTGRKGGLSVYWMAAASAIIVLGASIWFAPQKEKVWLQKEEPVIAVSREDELPSKEEMTIDKPKERVVISQTPELASLKDRSDREERQFSATTALRSKQSVTETEVVESPVEVNLSKGVAIPDNALASTDVLLEDRSSKEGPALAAVSTEPANDHSPKERNVKSIGDLVNFVVGKVDKRQDKLIQFQDSDEGSFITGVNLGFVKIKSRNYKED